MCNVIKGEKEMFIISMWAAGVYARETVWKILEIVTIASYF